jgi:cell division protein FtsI (penicillin-binding protein 3)
MNPKPLETGTRQSAAARFDDPEFGRLVYRRLRIAAMFVVLAWAVLAGRTFAIQVLWADRLSGRAGNQINQTVAVPAPRGEIYDRNGVPLAVNWHNQSFFAYPDENNIPVLAKKLSAVRKCSEQKLRRDLSGKQGKFTWLIRQADDQVARQIRSWDIKHVHSLPEMTRAYTNPDACRGVVGYVNTDNLGLAGIEYSCDKWLTGTNGVGVLWRDGLGRKYSYDPLRVAEPVPGNRVELTLDLGWQIVLKEELVRGIEEHHARSGMAILLDCRTGEILAMADAYSTTERRVAQDAKCRVISDVFEPGSSFKLVAFAAALSEGGMCPADRFDAGMGKGRFSNRWIRDDKEHGFLSLADAFRFSSNVATGRMANRVGGEKLYAWARRFGFGSPTGVMLPAEQPGSVPKHRWSEYMTAAFSIGHGVSVTTLQMAVAYAGLANGGLLLKPYLVRSVTDAAGRVVFRQKPFVVRRIMTPDVAAELLAMARGVVTDGTAKQINDPEFPLAGKTGTAEKPDLETGRMIKNKYVASFAGFWPADNPRLVGVVVLDQPEPIHYGGWTAAPILLNILRRGSCARGHNVVYEPPLRAAAPAADSLVPVDSSAETVAVCPAPGESFWQRRAVVDESDSGLTEGVMPDVVGLTAREAVVLIKKCGYESVLTGVGRVAQQIPPPGSPVMPGTTCQLALQ